MTLYVGDQKVAPIVPVEVPETFNSLNLNQWIGLEPLPQDLVLTPPDDCPNGLYAYKFQTPRNVKPSSFNTITLMGIVWKPSLYFSTFYTGNNTTIYKRNVNRVIAPQCIEIQDYAMYQTFGYCLVQNISFPLLTTIGGNGMNGAFRSCTSLTGISFPSLTTISSFGMSEAFYGCTSLTGISFPSLTTISSSGMNGAFRSCTSLTGISFPSLTTISSSGMSEAFYGCTSLTSVSFPSLTTIKSNSFGSYSYNYIFNNCKALTEIHFPAAMQATIEAMTGFAEKWGATNATISFDK